MADYAAVEPNSGKLNIIGVFNQLLAAQFPTTHHRMYFAVKLEGERLSKADENTLSIEMVDEDGKELLTIEGQFVMPATSPGIEPQCAIVFEFNQLTFQSPGDYRFHISVNDGELEESTVLQALKQQA